jgi:hypothetical protein
MQLLNPGETLEEMHKRVSIERVQRLEGMSIHMA